MNHYPPIRQLGTLHGPLLVFGGVYSNLAALEELMRLATQLRIPTSNILCTGDVVAYCASPEACVQAIRDWGIPCIAGNVALQLASDADDCGCNFEDDTRCDLFSRNWYPYAKRQLSQASLNWLSQLPLFLHFTYVGKRCCVLHGSYEKTAEFIFKSTPWTRKAEQLAAASADVVLAGHCGLPFHDVHKGQHWINAGVIGMPANDGSPQVWYALLQDEGQQLQYQHCAYTYDHERSARDMETNDLPRAYAHTLRTGIWDNCDILPSIETQQQGQPLQFSAQAAVPHTL